jgi:hypothetical protein
VKKGERSERYGQEIVRKCARRRSRRRRRRRRPRFKKVVAEPSSQRSIPLDVT